MKGKKVTFISISAVILALAIIYLIFFSTLGLHIYNGKDEIISAAQSFSRTAIVTKSGDVYINGSLDDAEAVRSASQSLKDTAICITPGASSSSSACTADTMPHRSGSPATAAQLSQMAKRHMFFHQSQRAMAHPQNSRTTFSVRDRPASAYIFSQPTADSDFLRLTIPPLSPS